METPESRLSFGLRVERLAEAYLLSEGGRRVLERNFRCKMGEIDLILEESLATGRIELVFVEVRCRQGGSWVGGIESVTFPKQLRLRRAIDHYLTRYRGRAQGIRVDLLAWDGKAWEHLRNVWI